MLLKDPKLRYIYHRDPYVTDSCELHISVRLHLDVDIGRLGIELSPIPNQAKY